MSRMKSALPFLLSIFIISLHAQSQENDEMSLLPEDEATLPAPAITSRQSQKIAKISYKGLFWLDESLLEAKNPFRVGDIFHPQKSRGYILALNELGYFGEIAVKVRPLSESEVELLIEVKEDPRIVSLAFSGNSQVKESEIEKATGYKEWKTITQQQLAIMVAQIKSIYMTKGYYHVEITPTISVDSEQKATVTVTILEGRRSVIKEVEFVGNDHLSSQALRTLIFTREDWLLGFLDRAGTYHPDALAMDRQFIENYYQSNGFLTARVKDVTVDENQKNHFLTVTFHIEEGEQYVIDNVSAPANEHMSEEEILAHIPVRPGQLYSKELIRQTVEQLRLVFGESGYIFSDITPSFVPNREQKTVAITFHTELGKPVRANRISISGNKKTFDKIIRRYINFDEGELLSTKMLDQTQERVERLGFFDKRQGVNWRITRLDEETADLDLILKEVPTGNVSASVGFGGNDDASRVPTGPQDSPSNSLKVSGTVSDTNLFGRGIAYNITGSYSRGDYSISASLYNPWLFNRPLGGGATVYQRKVRYDDFKNTTNIPTERTTGGSGTINYLSPLLGYSNLVLNAGFDDIQYNNVIANLSGEAKTSSSEFQAIIRRRFESGELAWLNGLIEQDRRNHPLQPSRGYHWAMSTKFGASPSAGKAGCASFGFVKWEADARWYTPLINEYDLIFHIHAHVGIVSALSNRTIPYRELFHIGGPATVRGFSFGQIGPNVLGDSLGSTKAFFVNVELLFPIKQDNSIRGVLFYDGGAGWDTPDADQITSPFFKNNSFNYRHAVGFGVRLTSPTPVRIDWGFKLDHKRRLRETLSEVHFTMSHEF